MAVDKDALFKPRTTEEELDVPGIGTIRVRALTRSEALEIRGKELPIAEMEQKLLAWAMVEPTLTVDEVRRWQDASAAGELEPITTAIARLSGMETSAPKEAMRRFRG